MPDKNISLEERVAELEKIEAARIKSLQNARYMFWKMLVEIMIEEHVG